MTGQNPLKTSQISINESDGTLHECETYLLYDWRESGLLIGPICLDKSLCLPENWSKLAQKVI